MSAEEWLERSVARALIVGDRARYPELVGAVEALMACGAVSNAIAADARQRLDEAFSDARTAPLRQVRPPVVAAPSIDRLDAVLSPVATLVEKQGMSVVLVAAELWTTTIIVRLAAISVQDGSEQAEREPGRASIAWASPGDVAHNPRRLDRHPLPMALLRLPLRLEDDVGTRYAGAGWQASGEAPWRAERRFVPGVPRTATRLAVAVDMPGHDDNDGLNLVLPAQP